MIKVKKRNGNLVPFDINKITSAIKKAFVSCNISEEYCPAAEIANKVVVTDGISVEDIQDQVESLLMAYPKVAKSYILYREKHSHVRDWVKQKEDFIEKYKKASNTANATVDDNSNVANKNIGVINSEIHKEDNILISRGMVTNKLKELYPDFDSKQYIRDLEKPE